jgi:hypothetical protein
MTASITYRRKLLVNPRLGSAVLSDRPRHVCAPGKVDAAALEVRADQ